MTIREHFNCNIVWNKIDGRKFFVNFYFRGQFSYLAYCIQTKNSKIQELTNKADDKYTLFVAVGNIKLGNWLHK